jgi:NAD-dependent deacetylase
MDQNDALKKAREALQQANSVFVLTGAGISAESGVPTFRDAGGLWKNFRPEEVATPQAFARDPKFVWEWYDYRRVQLKDIQPNKAHKSLAKIENSVDQFFLLTQNVEDLHEQAGSKNVGHIHGSIWEVKCTKEGTVRKDTNAPMQNLPPRCQQCGALERPNVVWFGETVRQDVVEATERFLANGEIDVVMVIGTGASFGYITEWANRARGANGVLIEINPNDTGLYGVDIQLRGKAGEILPQLLDETL